MGSYLLSNKRGEELLFKYGDYIGSSGVTINKPIIDKIDEFLKIDPKLRYSEISLMLTESGFPVDTHTVYKFMEARKEIQKPKPKKPIKIDWELFKEES